MPWLLGANARNLFQAISAHSDEKGSERNEPNGVQEEASSREFTELQEIHVRTSAPIELQPINSSDTTYPCRARSEFNVADNEDEKPPSFKKLYGRSSSVSGSLAKWRMKDSSPSRKRLLLDRKFSFQHNAMPSAAHVFLKRTQSNRDMRPAVREEDDKSKSPVGLKRTLATSSVALATWNKSFRNKIRQRAQSFKNLR